MITTLKLWLSEVNINYGHVSTEEPFLFVSVFFNDLEPLLGHVFPNLMGRGILHQ